MATLKMVRTRLRWSSGIEVGEECGGEDAEAGLAYAQRGVADVERIVGVDGGGEEVDAAPEESGDDDHGFAREAIAEPAGEGRGGHVGDHELEGEGAELRVGDVELVLDLLLHAGEDVAVDVVDEVERGEEDEGGGGSGDGGGARGFGCGGHVGLFLGGRIAGVFYIFFSGVVKAWFCWVIWGFLSVWVW